MKKKAEVKAPERPVDTYFNEYNWVYQQSANKALVHVSVLMTLFGLIALVWAIPFPHLQFLGRYNGFVNWASFLIAVMIYYHLRLSPVVSYLMLFLLFAFSFGIIQLEQWEKSGGFPLWAVGLIILGVGLSVQLWLLFAVKATNKARLLVKAPLWLFVSVLLKINVRY